jgi:1,4-dihydroxy-2-naphthoyl-CoA hydrolase
MEAPWETLMPEGWEPVVAFDVCFDAQYGLEVVDPGDAEDGSVRGRVPVRPELHNHLGVIHGGVFAAVAEALASRGTALAVMPHGQAAMGLGNDTTVIHSPSEGVIDVVARPLARGERAWLWAVECADEGGRLCAFTRVTVAVRDM